MSFLTEPAGLKLNIEGRDNWPSTNFVWGVGMKYSVAAPAEQTDIRGRKYLFKGWSNAGPAIQQITPEDIADRRRASGMKAMFEAVPQAVIQSSIPGMKIAVDGTGVCFSLPPGSAGRNRVERCGADRSSDQRSSRYEFTGWSDGAPAERTLTLTADSQPLRRNLPDRKPV